MTWFALLWVLGHLTLFGPYPNKSECLIGANVVMNEKMMPGYTRRETTIVCFEGDFIHRDGESQK